MIHFQDWAHSIPARCLLACFPIAVCFVTFDCRAACPSTEPGQASVGLAPAETRKFQAAMTALQAGDPAQAEIALKSLHDLYPENFAVNESLGLLYASESRPDDSLPRLQQASRTCPRSSIARANLGAAYLSLHQGQSAVRELNQANELEPGNPQTAAALGEAQMLLKHWSQASAAFAIALASRPKDADLLYNSALAYFNQAKYEKARSSLASSPEVSSSASAQSLMGDVEEKLGHFKEAAQHHANAVTLDPSEENIYLLGVEFLRHWTFGPAVATFSSGLRSFPESRRMQLGLAIAYYGNANFNSAIEVLSRLLAIEPDNSGYAELLGRSCVMPSEAQNPSCEAVTRFAELHPHDGMVVVDAVISMLHKPTGQQDLAKAHRLLQSALLADHQLPEANFELGVLWQTESKWKESIAPLKAALQSKPDYAAAHYRLARAYSRIGRTDEARHESEQYQIENKKHEADLDARMSEITTLVTNMP